MPSPRMYRFRSLFLSIALLIIGFVAGYHLWIATRPLSHMEVIVQPIKNVKLEYSKSGDILPEARQHVLLTLKNNDILSIHEDLCAPDCRQVLTLAKQSTWAKSWQYYGFQLGDKPIIYQIEGSAGMLLPASVLRSDHNMQAMIFGIGGVLFLFLLVGMRRGFIR